jgi:hypothetical protein
MSEPEGKSTSTESPAPEKTGEKGAEKPASETPEPRHSQSQSFLDRILGRECGGGSEGNAPPPEHSSPEKEAEKGTEKPAHEAPEAKQEQPQSFIDRLINEYGGGNEGSSGNGGEGADSWYERMKVRSLPEEQKEKDRSRDR